MEVGVTIHLLMVIMVVVPLKSKIAQQKTGGGIVANKFAGA